MFAGAFIRLALPRRADAFVGAPVSQARCARVSPEEASRETRDDLRPFAARFKRNSQKRLATDGKAAVVVGRGWSG